MARNPVISMPDRRHGIFRTGKKYLSDPKLLDKDLLDIHRVAIMRIGRELQNFLRKFGLSTRGMTVIDQPSYRNKLNKKSRDMHPDCHGAILAVDNDTSDLLAILSGKGSGPGIRKIVSKHYDADPAKKIKTRLLLKILRDKVYDILRSHGFSWKPLTKKQFIPKDPHHYKGKIYRVLPLWITDLKATGVRIRRARKRAE